MIYETFGERLRAERKRQGLTMRQLGDMCGLHLSAIGQYELDQHNPTIWAAARIADALGVSLDYLAGLTREDEA